MNSHHVTKVPASSMQRVDGKTIHALKKKSTHRIANQLAELSGELEAKSSQHVIL